MKVFGNYISLNYPNVKIVQVLSTSQLFVLNIRTILTKWTREQGGENPLGAKFDILLKMVPLESA